MGVDKTFFFPFSLKGEVNKRLEKEMVTHSSICLENPMDRGACQAMVNRVTQSWTQLKWLIMHHANKRMCVCCYLLAKSCLTLFDFVDCSLPGSSVHGIFQARILEWVTISYFKGSSCPRNWTCISCISGRFFNNEPPGKPLLITDRCLQN